MNSSCTVRKYFCEVSSVHKRSTRASTRNNYFMPFLKKSKLQTSIKYQDPLIWNSLDSTIKNSKSIKSFKSNLKKTLLEKYSLVNFSSIKARITYKSQNHIYSLKVCSIACLFCFFLLAFSFSLNLYYFLRLILKRWLQTRRSDDPFAVSLMSVIILLLVISIFLLCT